MIVGDSNMNEWASYLKVGTTALLLRMVEEDVQIRDMTLENPIRAIREISHDTTCKRRVRLANGREASALDMQKEYLDKALRWVDQRDDPVMKEIAGMWEHAITNLEHDQDNLDRQVDWIAKRKLIERYRAKHNLSLAHPRIALMDLAYHDVNRKRGLYYLLERRGHGRAHVRRGGHRARHAGASRRPRGPSSAASSSGRRNASGATSPSTGSTSSSTTRRSEPSCARTRSARPTNGSPNSSPRSDAIVLRGRSHRASSRPMSGSCT